MFSIISDIVGGGTSDCVVLTDASLRIPHGSYGQNPIPSVTWITVLLILIVGIPYLTHGERYRGPIQYEHLVLGQDRHMLIG